MHHHQLPEEVELFEHTIKQIDPLYCQKTFFGNRIGNAVKNNGDTLDKRLLTVWSGYSQANYAG